MKIDFPLPTDGKMHRYCFSCRKEGAIQVKDGATTRYFCNACGKTNDRAIYFKDHVVWLDKNKELWHESSGVFVRNTDGKFLFFKRTEFPFALTVPAGHVDVGESPEESAIRELKEETNIEGTLTHIGDADIVGDSCSAAADAHRWHTYLLKQTTNNNVRILEEGEKALWLSLNEAKEIGLAYVIEQIVNKYRSQLQS